MKIIDELTNEEIANPDLGVGILFETLWASPEAWATIDNVNKFALDDGDYEDVYLYHIWTQAELEAQEREKADREKQQLINLLPNAIADLSGIVSEGATSVQVIMDALADLSEIVSELAVKEVNNG